MQYFTRKFFLFEHEFLQYWKLRVILMTSHTFKNSSCIHFSFLRRFWFRSLKKFFTGSYLLRCSNLEVLKLQYHIIRSTSIALHFSKSTKFGYLQPFFPFHSYSLFEAGVEEISVFAVRSFNFNHKVVHEKAMKWTLNIT